MQGVDSVIYATEIVRDPIHGHTVQFLARLPAGIDFDITEEFVLKRRLHDGMKAALLPIFENSNEQQSSLPEATCRADTQEPFQP
jgi:hypothetical protein